MLHLRDVYVLVLKAFLTVMLVSEQSTTPIALIYHFITFFKTGQHNQRNSPPPLGVLLVGRPGPGQRLQGVDEGVAGEEHVQPPEPRVLAEGVVRSGKPSGKKSGRVQTMSKRFFLQNSCMATLATSSLPPPMLHHGLL